MKIVDYLRTNFTPHYNNSIDMTFLSLKASYYFIVNAFFPAIYSKEGLRIIEKIHEKYNLKYELV
jgi:hypothetical protein